jgi:hypothetical protein
MGKATVLLGTGIMTLILAFIGTNHYNNDKEVKSNSYVGTYGNYENDPNLILDADFCLFEDVTYIEDEDEIILDFDTADYLPIGFNAYEGMDFDLNEIEYVEIEPEIELGFETKDYLPIGFNPYDEPKLNIADIVYIEIDEEFELGFDTKQYLPEGFNAHAEVEVNLDDI